jgi:hypothetical protein
MTRGIDFCRACDSKHLFSALDLGNLPIANELLENPSRFELFPLHLRICKSCGLGQVADVVTPERLFRDYRYQSSVSQTFLSHARGYVNQVLERLDWKEDDWVLEIASNDGYLLKNFLEREIKVLGIEPASNIASQAASQGVPTICEFFGTSLAKELMEKFGKPRLIIANNVFAHVPDIQDFIQGLGLLMDERTLVSIENPSIMNLINDSQFDSIYHEHYSYLSVNAVDALSSRFDLNLIDVELTPTHGGSNRYWLSRNSLLKNSRVLEIAEWERSSGLFDEEVWSGFRSKVRNIREEFRSFVTNAKMRGEIVVGYGAAAKASTLINYAGILPNEIEFIVDESLEKIGRIMPSPLIPILSREILERTKFNHVVIFPWNIADEIAKKLKEIDSGDFKLWCFIPEKRRLN